MESLRMPQDPPKELDPKMDGSFYERCIEWLAGRTVE
jgi:hypothetical protein